MKLSITAKDIMTAKVLVANPDWSVDQLTTFLLEHSISGAPVVSELGEPIGVISITDVARSSGIRSEIAEGQRAVRERAPNYYTSMSGQDLDAEDLDALRIEAPETPVCVREIMTPVVFSVQENTPLQEIADSMLRGGIHRVLVIRQKRIVGIISSMDLLKVVRDL